MSKQLYKVQITNHCEAVLRDTAYSIAVDLSTPEEAISWAMKMREQISMLEYFPAKVQLTPDLEEVQGNITRLKTEIAAVEAKMGAFLKELGL